VGLVATIDDRGGIAANEKKSYFEVIYAGAVSLSQTLSLSGSAPKPLWLSEEGAAG
jgi:hypothetical protein